MKKSIFLLFPAFFISITISYSQHSFGLKANAGASRLYFSEDSDFDSGPKNKLTNGENRLFTLPVNPANVEAGIHQSPNKNSYCFGISILPQIVWLRKEFRNKSSGYGIGLHYIKNIKKIGIEADLLYKFQHGASFCRGFRTDAFCVVDGNNIKYSTEKWHSIQAPFLFHYQLYKSFFSLIGGLQVDYLLQNASLLVNDYNPFNFYATSGVGSRMIINKNLSFLTQVRFEKNISNVFPSLRKNDFARIGVMVGLSFGDFN